MNEQSSGAIVVLMTAASAEEATRIAEMLVNNKLAACVQVIPEIQSIYLWKGEVQRDREVLMVAKTMSGNFAELQKQVRAMHSYEIPEIIAIRVVAGSEDYLKWLTGSLEGS